MKKQLLFIPLLLLGGCDLEDLLRPSTPECYHADTVKLAEQIITDNLNEAKKLFGDMIDSISVKMTPKYELAYSRDTRQRTCLAQLTITSDNKEIDDVLPMIGLKNTEITYTVSIIKTQEGYNQLVQIKE